MYAQTTQETNTLLIAGSFFGYSNEILKLLKQRGHRVAWFEDRPATDTFSKAALRLAPSLLAEKSDAYFQDIIDRLAGQPIRDVLVIKGEALSPQMAQRMREAFPLARFTLYFWDSFRNMPADSPEKIPAFDRAFSFDPQDVQSDSRLQYRPLFYLDDYATAAHAKCDIDVLFFGTAHTDRYAVLSRLGQALPPRLRFEKIMYMPAPWLYLARKLFSPPYWGASRSEFIFSPLGKDAIMALMARSSTIVDIERSVQSGYTMRMLEVLGMRKKLITTNPAVLDADFYNPRNIAVIDRHAPRLSADFLATPYQDVPASIFKRYSLSSWLDEVLPEHAQ